MIVSGARMKRSALWRWLVGIVLLGAAAGSAFALFSDGPSKSAVEATGKALDDVWPVELASASELEAAQALAPPVRSWVAQPSASERDHELLLDWIGVEASTAKPFEVFW